jgi:hypothetical protein
MPGLLKIGYTERAMEERLQEANSSGTWGPPTDYVIETSKFVSEPNHKEKLIHKILAENRVNPRKEFFRVDVEKIHLLFGLMEENANTKPEPTEKLTGDEVLNLFLNEYIYPPSESGEVKWDTIADVFTKWKKNNGYTNGAVINLRKTLIDAYGKPEWGGGWSAFGLKSYL